MELADHRDTGECHLRERGAGQREVEVGVESLRCPVHLLAPGPERAGPALGSVAKGTVEGVTVGVGQARNDDPREAVCLVGRVDVGLDGDDPPAVHRDADSGEHTVTDEGLLTPELGVVHDPTRSTNAVMRATNSSRWCRSNSSHVAKVVASSTRSTINVPSRWSHSCLPGTRGQAPFDLLVADAIAVEVVDEDVDVAADIAAKRHRQAAFVDHDRLVVEWLDLGVDGDRQGIGGL